MATPSFGRIGEGGSAAHWDTFDVRAIPNPIPD